MKAVPIYLLEDFIHDGKIRVSYDYAVIGTPNQPTTVKCFTCNGTQLYNEFTLGVDAFFSKLEAISTAEEMLDVRINAAKEEIQHCNSLVVTVEEP